jgi:hypothetical protein
MGSDMGFDAWEFRIENLKTFIDKWTAVLRGC